ncbi:leucine-rich repeat-containing protein 23 [Aulostomus maculatus]
MSDMDEDEVVSDAEREEEAQRDGQGEKKEVCSLTQETITEGLSLLCRAGNGLGHAFVKLELVDKELEEVAALRSYIHIRFLDLSDNCLKDLSPLACLTQLLWLKVDNNSVTSFQGHFPQLTYLQWLSVAGNQLTGLEGLVAPALESLNLTANRIQRVSGLHGGCFSNLVALELRGNQLETTDGINLPKLQRLYLAQNKIKRLEGLARLECLTTLHLRDNKLDSLDGLSPNMKNLHYLNVRGNAIFHESCLQSLELVSKTLRQLILQDNPLMETTDYRQHVLVLAPKLERVDKDPVSSDERTEVLERIQELKEEEVHKPEDV